MAAPTAAAAMTTVIIEPEKRSPMMISLYLAVRCCIRNSPMNANCHYVSKALVYRASVCGEKRGTIGADDGPSRRFRRAAHVRCCRSGTYPPSLISVARHLFRLLSAAISSHQPVVGALLKFESEN